MFSMFIHYLLVWKEKNKKQTINLICYYCNKPFIKDLKEYKRRLEISGKNEFYCSLKCRNNRVRIDEFTPFRTFLVLCKKNVKLKKLEYDLDLSYIKNLWEQQNGICPYTKLKMLLFPTMNKKEFKPDAASLDRIDSSKGYIKGNVQFVCLSINYAKNRFNLIDFNDFLNKILK